MTRYTPAPVTNLQLWECMDCGAVVSSKPTHDIFHNQLMQMAVNATELGKVLLKFMESND